MKTTAENLCREWTTADTDGKDIGRPTLAVKRRPPISCALNGSENRPQISSRLFERPAALQERIFQRVFDLAEIARFTSDEARIYEESLKHYRDMNNVINSAKREGKEEGREEGRMEAKFEDARKMKAKGYPVEYIVEITGLSAEEIEALL